VVLQERAVRTRRAIVDAAAEVFVAGGLRSASVADISRRAGVSGGALHFHFETKEALAAVVAAEAREALGRLVAEVGEVGADPALALQRLVDSSYALAALVRRDALVRAGFRLGCEQPFRGGPMDLRRFWEHLVRGMLARAAGQSPPQVKVALQGAARVVTAGTLGLEVLARTDPAWVSDDSLHDLWRMLLPGLALVGLQVADIRSEGRR
jgi:AcrR family transcriptional regulator